MYRDSKKIKEHRMTIRFNEYEYSKILHYTLLDGGQPSTLMRKIVMSEIEKRLARIFAMTVDKVDEQYRGEKNEQR